MDCGTAVNPNLITQQMQSAIVFGLTAALYGEITVEKGRVQQSNSHNLRALRIFACPAISVEVMPSSAHPEGVGEPGTPLIAPAVANAAFCIDSTAPAQPTTAIGLSHGVQQLQWPQRMKP